MYITVSVYFFIFENIEVDRIRFMYLHTTVKIESTVADIIRHVFAGTKKLKKKLLVNIIEWIRITMLTAISKMDFITFKLPLFL